jgi:hypothetical protein
MANPFREIARHFPADSRSNDSHWCALVVALASALADASPIESSFANPWRESLHRLRTVAGGDTPAIRRLAELWGDRVESR